jgi:hypothetical protein
VCVLVVCLLWKDFVCMCFVVCVGVMESEIVKERNGERYL